MGVNDALIEGYSCLTLPPQLDESNDDVDVCVVSYANNDEVVTDEVSLVDSMGIHKERAV